MVKEVGLKENRTKKKLLDNDMQRPKPIFQGSLDQNVWPGSIIQTDIQTNIQRKKSIHTQTCFFQ